MNSINHSPVDVIFDFRKPSVDFAKRQRICENVPMLYVYLNVDSTCVCLNFATGTLPLF